MMQATRKLVLVCCVMLGAPGATLAADVAVPKAEPISLGSAPPKDDLSNCAFITNDCEVCTVDATGKASCTSQGIACVPTSRSCLIQKK